MAKGKQQSDDQPEQGGRSFRAETGKFDSLKVNESITGIFMGAKSQTITDRRARPPVPKDVFVLKLRDEEHDRVIKLPCASMLLQTWEDLVDEYGNGDQEAAITALRGKKMVINRGEDSSTRDGNKLGTYEIIVFD
jgi:hypothetical protein